MNASSDTAALREAAIAAVLRLRSAGFEAYWAGGCVRDMLRAREPADYDIATSAPPERSLDLFPGAVAVGKSFGVIRAPLDGFWFEVATFRSDGGYRDGRRPETVSFADAPTDASRRDFTINAMFYDPIADRILDYTGGRTDLAARVVRCVGDPAARFAEDRLRMLRAARFAAVLEFDIAPETAAAIRERAPTILDISAERIRDELTRLLTESRRPGDALRLLDALGLLAPLLPEVKALQGQSQPAQFHPEGDVFEHTVLMLNHMERAGPRLAFAVLLHDIGKPMTARAAADRIRFDGHDAAGADAAASVLRRLRFPNDDVESISGCVRRHMQFMNVRDMRPATLRRMIGRPDFETELELHRLDCLASHGQLDNHRFLVEFRDQLAAEPPMPPAWVGGHDILALGVPEGPAVGRWRREAYDAQLEGRFSGRDDLLEWLSARIHTEPAASSPETTADGH